MRVRTYAAFAGSAVLAGSGLMATAAYAQSNGTASTTSATGSDEAPEEIVVTARRREELLEDVPQTISAITPTDIQKLNLLNLQDLSGVVPGLQISTTGSAFNNNDTLRGVTFTPAAGTQNTVAFYVNDVSVTNNLVSTSNFDVGQIEVLSGPQGTLRGEPAPSGSLTITTRKPDLEQFGGYATVTGTNHANTNENGAVNLPVIQGKLAVRLAGIADDDFYNDVRSINSPVNPFSRTYGGRASIRFEPVDSIEANVVYQHLYSHQQYFDQVEGSGAPGGVNPNAPAGYNGPPLGPLQRLGVETYPNNEYTTTDLITGSLDWHVLGQVVSYDAGYWKYAINNSDDTDTAHQVPDITAANPIPRLPSQFDTPSSSQYAQTDEFRVSSETPLFDFMDYTAGLFYRNTRNEVNTTQLATFLPGSFGSPLGASSPYTYDPNYTLQLLVQSPAQTKEYSEFVHLTFHLQDNTELALGGRYLHYENWGFTEGTLQPDGIFVASPVPVPCSFIGLGSTYPGTCDIPGSVAFKGRTTALPLSSLNQDDHAVIYNVSLSHKFADSFLAYISSGSSWRPPATSVGISNATNDPTLNALVHVKPEKSYDFEAGFKWTYLENRGRLNLAFYHQQFDNFIYYGQPTLYLDNNGSSTSATNFNFTTNPNAVINGIDFDSGFQLTRQWNVDLTGSYTNGHLTGASIPCNPPNGGTTPAAFPAGTFVFFCPGHASTSTQPDFNATARTEYDLPIGQLPNVNAFVRGLYVFYGRNPHASEFYVTPSYGLFNLYTGLRSGNGAWEVALFAKNLFDTQRLLNLGFPTAHPGGGGAILDQTFGPSGYYQVGVNQAGLTPPQEFGLTLTYSIGSR
jgi:outer membrane receptor protein involved in Fe transport